VATDSVLCSVRDNFKRRCIVPRNFSLEKNQVPRELALIPSLPGGSMKFIRWKLKMSYHTAFPS
jgi:hypothetical protein